MHDPKGILLEADSGEGALGWYLLDNGDGHERHEDSVHILRIARVSPPASGDDDEGTCNVVATGSNEFGAFLALGFATRVPETDQSAASVSWNLTLARRYIGERDPRGKLSHDEILAALSIEETSSGKPWNAPLLSAKWKPLVRANKKKPSRDGEKTETKVASGSSTLSSSNNNNSTSSNKANGAEESDVDEHASSSAISSGSHSRTSSSSSDCGSNKSVIFTAGKTSVSPSGSSHNKPAEVDSAHHTGSAAKKARISPCPGATPP
jgi:hypothetical protein